MRWCWAGPAWLPVTGDSGRVQGGGQPPAYPWGATPMDDPEGLLPIPGPHRDVGQLHRRSGPTSTAPRPEGDQGAGLGAPELPLGDLHTGHLGQGKAVGEAQRTPSDPAGVDPERSPAPSQRIMPAAVEAAHRKANGDASGVPVCHGKDRTVPGCSARTVVVMVATKADRIPGGIACGRAEQTGDGPGVGGGDDRPRHRGGRGRSSCPSSNWVDRSPQNRLLPGPG